MYINGIYLALSFEMARMSPYNLMGLSVFLVMVVTKGKPGELALDLDTIKAFR